MKIGFDAKRALQNNAGLGNYSRYILQILAESFPANEYLLFAPKNKANPRMACIIKHACMQTIFPKGIYKTFRSLWRLWGIRHALKHSHIKVFHGLSNEIPLCIKPMRKRIKSVVTIHDLIFMRYPQYYKAIDRLIYRLKTRHACRNANCVIAISECTKRDILHFIGIPADKIKVVYQGCHPVFYAKVDDASKAAIVRKYALPPHFILNVGTIEERKNLLALVMAMPELPSDVHVAAVGRFTKYQREVEKFACGHGLSSRLHLLNDVPLSDLPALYQSAAVFVYPSVFEGFGIPIIEAMACGAPVVAACGSCLEEAGGDAAIYVNARSPVAIADAINKVLNNHELAMLMRAKGMEHIRRFADNKIARDLMNIYHDLR
jgi:glycosyltransferase involved in cell wall biosynthesis